MFGRKKKENKEIAKASLDLWAFVRAVLVFVEEDPNRVKSFIKNMCEVKGTPTKQDVLDIRTDLAKAIGWASSSLAETEKRLKEFK